MNKNSAIDWLEKAWHHYRSGVILFDAHHYTDTIAVDLHYAVEIMLKSYLAYQNKKIHKTHDLIELSSHIEKYINFDENELSLLDIITRYHIEGSYPTLSRTLPSRKEIEEVLIFTEDLFYNTCRILNISQEIINKITYKEDNK